MHFWASHQRKEAWKYNSKKLKIERGYLMEPGSEADGRGDSQKSLQAKDILGVQVGGNFSFLFLSFLSFKILLI